MESELDRKRRWSALSGPRELWRALALMSDEDKAAFWRRYSEANAEEERIEAAALPKPSLSSIMIDAIRKEKARKSRVFHAAEQKLRTNIASRADENPYDDDDWDYVRRNVAAGAAHDRSVLGLEAGAPGYRRVRTAAGAVKVETLRRRLSKAETKRRRAILALEDNITAARARDEPAVVIGALLNAAKGLISHGDFGPWLTNKIGLSRRRAQELMAAAKGENQMRGETKKS